MVFNAIAHLVGVKGASLWEYGWLQLPFCSKASGPKLLEVVLIMALAECLFPGRTQVLLPTPGVLHTVPEICHGRCFPADCSTAAVPTLLESSPDRNWQPRWFKEIVPKIITFHFLSWRDRSHHEEASVGHIQDVPMSCSELALCTELLLSVWKC